LITIKRYPNRRLYDTSQSQYVNLAYIRKLVISSSEFKIIDSKSQEDRTRSVLLQIINEEETSENQSLLTNNLLKKLISFYGNSNQSYLQEFLEQSLSIFIEQQGNMSSIVNRVQKNSPFGLINDVVKSNINLWANLNKEKDKDKDN